MVGSFLKEASEWVSSALNEVEQVLSAPVDDPGRVTTLVSRTMYVSQGFGTRTKGYVKTHLESFDGRVHREKGVSSLSTMKAFIFLPKKRMIFFVTILVTTQRDQQLSSFLSTPKQQRLTQDTLWDGPC